MIYSLSIVPILIILLILSFTIVNWKKNFHTQKKIILILLSVVVLNLVAWVVGFRAHANSTDLYILFLLGLVILFSDKDAVELCRKPFVFLMMANLFFYTIETQLGLMSVFVGTFHQAYLSVSNFLTSNIGLSSNTQSIIRKVNQYIIFVRPSGLFSNLHLSSFVLFCFYAYLNIQNKSRILQYAIILMVLIGGTMQTIFCMIIYLLLCSISSLKKFGLLLLFLVLPFIIYVLAVYGPQKVNESNNMYRIFSDSLVILKTIPLNRLLLGDSIYSIIDLLGSSMDHPELLIESGLLRYTVTIGLVNIFFIFFIFFKLFRSEARADNRPYYFLIATLGTYVHYFMTATFVGSILVAFIFRSQQFKKRQNQGSVNQVENKNKNKRPVSILKWIIH